MEKDLQKRREPLPRTSSIHEASRMIDRELAEQTIQKWGRSLQIDMLIEEMSELITKLCHFRRDRLDADWYNQIAEECADVLITMESVVLCTMDTNILKHHIKRKTKRLDALVNGGNYADRVTKKNPDS